MWRPHFSHMSKKNTSEDVNILADQRGAVAHPWSGSLVTVRAETARIERRPRLGLRVVHVQVVQVVTSERTLAA